MIFQAGLPQDQITSCIRDIHSATGTDSMMLSEQGSYRQSLRLVILVLFFVWLCIDPFGLCLCVSPREEAGGFVLRIFMSQNFGSDVLILGIIELALHTSRFRILLIWQALLFIIYGISLN